MTQGNDHGDVRGDVRAQIREFLTTRRARISPEQAGLPAYGEDRRRVPGLRRSEVASLAGISPEYMTKLERGNATGVSASVIDGLAQALQLDDAERAHLEDLLRTAGSTRPPRRRPARQRVRPTVQRILDSMSGAPAFVLNGRLDILAANDTVALLRAEAGRDPYDRDLFDLIGQLSTRSDEFRQRWAAHNVRIHTSGAKLLHHPVVGDLDLAFESLPRPQTPARACSPTPPNPDHPPRTPQPAGQLGRHHGQPRQGSRAQLDTPKGRLSGQHRDFGRQLKNLVDKFSEGIRRTSIRTWTRHTSGPG
jgi:transcriptional regulator with XRE-family HTH domain